MKKKWGLSVVRVIALAVGQRQGAIAFSRAHHPFRLKTLREQQGRAWHRQTG